jgi:hypothetical protein
MSAGELAVVVGGVVVLLVAVVAFQVGVLVGQERGVNETLRKSSLEDIYAYYGITDDEPYIDLGVCPGCGGDADNGHSRDVPPSPYYCTKCENNPEAIERAAGL